MKKFALAHSSQDHVDTRKKNITLLGADRPRFPGIGRRKHSYDAAVRGFYKKTVSPRFRRVQGLRFRSVRSAMFKSFYTRVPKTESSSRLRRSARTGVVASPTTYFSRQ